jgi:enoyl-CoA hydratase
MFEFLTYEKQGYVGCLTINRPKELNILSNALQEEMFKALDLIESDGDLRVLILTGSGEKAFMAGADIKELQARDFIIAREQTRRRQQLYNRFSEMRIPVIAAINGVAFGAGLELVLACTLRIACEGARLGALEINLGIMPGEGGTQRLPRLVGFGRAMEMALTGEPVDAEEAYRIGLVNKVVQREKLMDEARAMAEKIASKAPIAVQCVKEAVNRSMEVGLYEGMAHESYLQAYTCATEDKKEGISAFLEKRKPQFQGK